MHHGRHCGRGMFPFKCTINIFVRAGVVEGEGVNSERYLKWGDGGGRGSLRNLSKTVLK